MKKLLILALLLLTMACTITRPVAVTTEDASNRVGEACEVGIFIFPPYQGQDATIEKAKNNGKITKISSVDSVFTHYFVFSKRCTIVHGS